LFTARAPSGVEPDRLAALWESADPRSRAPTPGSGSSRGHRPARVPACSPAALLCCLAMRPLGFYP